MISTVYCLIQTSDLLEISFGSDRFIELSALLDSNPYSTWLGPTKHELSVRKADLVRVELAKINPVFVLT